MSSFASSSSITRIFEISCGVRIMGILYLMSDFLLKNLHKNIKNAPNVRKGNLTLQGFFFIATKKQNFLQTPNNLLNLPYNALCV